MQIDDYVLLGKLFTDTFKTLVYVSNGQLNLVLDKDGISVNLVSSLQYPMNFDDDFDAWDYIDYLVEKNIFKILCDNHSDEDDDVMQSNLLPFELSGVEEIEGLQVTTIIEDPPVLELKELPKHLCYAFLDDQEKYPPLVYHKNKKI